MDSIIPENLRERHREGYDQTMKTGRTQYSRNLLAVPAIRKDGTRISIEFTIALIRTDDRKLPSPAAILREVTHDGIRTRTVANVWQLLKRRSPACRSCEICFVEEKTIMAAKMQNSRRGIWLRKTATSFINFKRSKKASFC